MSGQFGGLGVFGTWNGLCKVDPPPPPIDRPTFLWTLLLMDKSCMTLRTLNYGNYGIFLIMGHAGFCPSTVVMGSLP